MVSGVGEEGEVCVKGPCVGRRSIGTARGPRALDPWGVGPLGLQTTHGTAWNHGMTVEIP